jgi:hypothetical protein
MSFKLELITSEQWKGMSSFAHKISFGKSYPSDFERIDFAILAIDACEIPMGFITVLEFNKNHIYWQYGGVFPGTKNTVNSYKIYSAARDLCAQTYKSVSTFIESDNITMLKFAFKLGFKIIGMKHIFGQNCVELFLNLERM